MTGIRRMMFVAGVAGMFLTLACPGMAEDRQGSFWYALDHLTSASEDAQALVWVALPASWHGQEFQVTAIEPEPVAVLEDPVTGNRVIEWLFEPDAKKPTTNRFFHFDFTMKEKSVRVEVEAAKVEALDRSSAEYVAYTRPETWIQTDGQMLDRARKIVGEEKNPWRQTEALFHWCVENLEFVPGGTDKRDALSTLNGRRGDCGQYGRLFVGLCRSIGIPARTVANEWISGGAHVFAEVWLPEYGWIPADISLAQMLMPGGGGFSSEEVESFMARREVPLGDPDWFLGNLYSNRLITSVGNNITFNSPTLGKEIKFQSMKPGGAKAYPEAVQISGFNDDLIHGGFFVFDEKVETDEDAHRLTHMRLANKFFKVGLYEVVEEGCRKSLDQYSDGVEPWMNMGKVYMHKGEYYKAESAFLRAIRGQAGDRREKQESLIWTHNYLGNCYDLLDYRERAEEQYRLVVEMGNNYRGAVDYARKYLKKPFTEVKN